MEAEFVGEGTVVGVGSRLGVGSWVGKVRGFGFFLEGGGGCGFLFEFSILPALGESGRYGVGVLGLTLSRETVLQDMRHVHGRAGGGNPRFHGCVGGRAEEDGEEGVGGFSDKGGGESEGGGGGVDGGGGEVGWVVAGGAKWEIEGREERCGGFAGMCDGDVV